MKFLLVNLCFFISNLAFAQVYEFKSPFIKGESDVAYDGQIARQVLINSLKVQMDKPLNSSGDLLQKGLFETGEEGALKVLNTFYDYSPEPKAEEVLYGFYGYTPLYFQNFNTVSGLLPVKSEFPYDSSDNAQEDDKLVLDYIFPETTANLIKKIAGNDNPLVHGKLLGFGQSFVHYPHSKEEDAFFKDVTYEHTPDGLVNYFMSLWAEDAGRGFEFVVQVGPEKFERVSKVGVLSNGWNLIQLNQKFLHGAISFSQAARDYLSTDLGESKGLNADNTKPAKPGRAYSTQAHHWDEALGYFGASRDFLSQDLNEVKKGYASDINLDQEIDLKSEVNFGLSVNAAKRDLGSKGTENFSENIFKNLVKGRDLINKSPDGYKEELKVVAKEIITEWERLFAANTIHYINKTIAEYNKFETSKMSFLNLSKYWSEMKGFALAFQFNPHSVMSIIEFSELHQLLGYQPKLEPKEFENYILNLTMARSRLVNTYKFDSNAAKEM